jgi:hypothetical protein
MRADMSWIISADIESAALPGNVGLMSQRVCLSAIFRGIGYAESVFCPGYQKFVTPQPENESSAYGGEDGDLAWNSILFRAEELIRFNLRAIKVKHTFSLKRGFCRCRRLTREGIPLFPSHLDRVQLSLAQVGSIEV